MAFCAGVVAWMELFMALADNPETYLRAVNLSGYPICALVVAMVWFIRLRLDTGRMWLAILISGLWVGGMLIELLTPGAFMVSSVVIDNRETIWGEAYTVGVLTSPWVKLLLLDLPTPLIAVFVADAGFQAYRRGARRDAIVFGGATFFFTVVAGVHAVLVDNGAIQTPYMISIAFVAIAVALGFGLANDVTRAAIATRGLELQRRRWRALLNGVQLAAIRTDKEGRIAYINEFLQEMLGRPLDDIIGKHLVDLAAPGRHNELNEILYLARVDMLVPRATGAFATAQNEIREFVLFNVRMTDGSGDFDGLVFIGEDVTDALRTSEELVRTQRDLERLSRILTLGELAATLAHELSQPIGAVLSNVQSAEMIRKRDGKEPDEIDEILADILRDIRRAAEVMNHVRSFSFNKPPIVEWFELGNSIGQVNNILKNEADAKHIKIVLDGPDAPIPVNASRIELQQVLMNLSLNGVQALTGSDVLDKQLWIRWRELDAIVEVCVDDNGPGLGDQNTSNLFDAFSTTRSGGMGIGLAVSRRIVERHRGTIEATRSPAGGARFRLTLPIGVKERGIAAQ